MMVSTTTARDAIAGERLTHHVRATGRLVGLTLAEAGQAGIILTYTIALLLPGGRGGLIAPILRESFLGTELWVLLGLLIGAPQVVGVIGAWLGVVPPHQLRMIWLTMSVAYHVRLATLWLFAGSLVGVYVSVFFALSASMALRRVHRFNGEGERLVRLPR